MPKISVFHKGQDGCGESPLWSVQHQALYWLDNVNCMIYRKPFSGAGFEAWGLPDHPGSLSEIEGDPSGLTVTLPKGLYRLDLETSKLSFLRGPKGLPDGTRFNDGKTAPNGDLWVSTMQNNFGPGGAEIPVTQRIGSLYRVHDGEFKEQSNRLVIPNTLAWTPDQSSFYFGDSVIGAIWRYEYDATTGDIGARETFCVLEDYGVPDGSTIDQDSVLWNARHGAGCIIGMDPTRKLIETVDLKAIKPTSCMFGGPNLDILFVTTATQGMTASDLETYPHSGSVLAIEGLSKGYSETLAKSII